MTIYEIVANRVIDRLTLAEEKGETFNWVKPFDITEGKRFPCNYGALIPYTGINRIIAEADEYLTFNQIKEPNNKNKDEFYSIRKGAKATPIVYFNWGEEKDKDGNPKLDEDGNVIKRPFMKYYSVFSRQDVVNRNGENLPSNFPTKHFNYDDIEKLTQRELLRFTSMVKHYCDKNNFELQIVNDGTEAYFSPSDRVVRVPHISSFSSVFDYVSTVAHELVHSTGLDLKRIDAHKFMNREKYSKEELVAEIGASMLISQFRIADDRKNVDNPIAYIQGWRGFIKDNDTKGIIITAAQQAQKAVNMIFDSREILKHLETIKEDESAFENLPDYIKFDIDFCKEAYKVNPYSWDFMDSEIQEEIAEELNENLTINVCEYSDDER